jgi:hypothetical protein
VNPLWRRTPCRACEDTPGRWRGACSVVRCGRLAPLWQGRYRPPVGASRDESGFRAHGSNQRFHRPAPHCPSASTGPSLAGVSPAATRFSFLRGGSGDRQRHCPVNREHHRGRSSTGRREHDDDRRDDRDTTRNRVREAPQLRDDKARALASRGSDGRPVWLLGWRAHGRVFSDASSATARPELWMLRRGGVMALTETGAARATPGRRVASPAPAATVGSLFRTALSEIHARQDVSWA